MNALGKSLVVVQMAFALMFMTWAVMIYLQFNDFGWKEPFKVWESKAEGNQSGYRVPSLLDKRTAQLQELYRYSERAVPNIQPAIDLLTQTMEFFPKNHQFYVAELDKLRTGDGDIAPKEFVWKDGQLVIESKTSTAKQAIEAPRDEKRFGKPLMKGHAPGIKKDEPITKSTKTMLQERDKLTAEIKTLTAELAQLVKDADEITIQLYGTKDDKGDSVDIGLYEVLDAEQNHQDKIRQELDYITPIFVDAQRRADSFDDRLAGMMRTLTKLRKQ